MARGGGHARAVVGLEVLKTLGTDVALIHLYGLSQKLKFKGLKNKAGEMIEELALERGLTPDELADRLVPDFDLDEQGSMTLDYGFRSFRVGFDEQLKPFVFDQEQKRLKNLPKPGKKDDEEKAPLAYQAFKALKKDVKMVAAQQVARLESAMIRRRRWKAEPFKELFVDHPFLIHLVSRLVWGVWREDDLVSR